MRPENTPEDELDRENTARIRELREAADFGRLSKGLFHDLMGPLTTLGLCIETLKDADPIGAGSVSTDIYTKRMIQASKEMSMFLCDIRKYIAGYRSTCAAYTAATREGTTSRHTFCINDLCAQTIKLWKYKIRDSNIEVNIVQKHKITYNGISFHFYQIFSNLLSNAIDACDGVSDRDRKINITLAKYSKIITIKIADTGIGIPEHTLARIFEPFFSTKKADRGSGIGLSIIKDIVEHDLHGTVQVTSTVGVGTTFTICFPE